MRNTYTDGGTIANVMARISTSVANVTSSRPDFVIHISIYFNKKRIKTMSTFDSQQYIMYYKVTYINQRLHIRICGKAVRVEKVTGEKGQR